MSVSANTFLLRSIFPFKQEIRTSCKHILATIDIPFRARTANRTRFKKAFLVFFHVYRTRNIHIHHVYFWHHILATIDYPLSNKNCEPHAHLEGISGVLPRLERRIYTYIMSVSASTFLLRSIFPFEQELRTARVLRGHEFWCSSTF